MIEREHPTVDGVDLRHLAAGPDEVKALLRIATSSAVDGWEPGRQHPGYFKTEIDEAWVIETFDTLTSMHFRDVRRDLLKWAGAKVVTPTKLADSYFIYFPPGEGVDEHIDAAPSPDLKHVRANLVLMQNAQLLFLVRASFMHGPSPVTLDVGDAVRFASSEVHHQVWPSLGGRLVFSVGAIVPKEKP